MIDLINQGLDISVSIGVWNNTSEDITGYDPETNKWEITSYYDGGSKTLTLTYKQLINSLYNALETHRLSKDKYNNIIEEIENIKKEIKV